MWRNFLLTGVLFILSGSILYVTVLNLDPLGEQRIVAFLSFFLAIFFGVMSFFTFIFFFALELFHGKKLGSRDFSRSMRRGMLVAFFVCGILLLQLFRFVGALEVSILACFLASVEWVFMGHKSVDRISG